MNFGNIFAGIVIILIGLLFDILLLIFNKKIKSPWIVLGITLLCDFIALLLWAYVPEGIMPHCLHCLDVSDGYIFDKNNLKEFTILISSIIGIILLISKYKMKKGWINTILKILSILFICVVGVILALAIAYA